MECRANATLFVNAHMAQVVDDAHGGHLQVLFYGKRLLDLTGRFASRTLRSGHFRRFRHCSTHFVNLLLKYFELDGVASCFLSDDLMSTDEQVGEFIGRKLMRRITLPEFVRTCQFSVVDVLAARWHSVSL